MTATAGRPPTPSSRPSKTPRRLRTQPPGQNAATSQSSMPPSKPPSTRPTTPPAHLQAYHTPCAPLACPRLRTTTAQTDAWIRLTHPLPHAHLSALLRLTFSRALRYHHASYTRRGHLYMPSERIQRRIDSFLDRAEQAADALEWAVVAETARAVLAIEATNEDARDFLSMAVANGVAEAAEPARRPTAVSTEQPANSVIEAAAIVEQLEAATPSPESDPDSFAGGRYRVLRFLGEGGKKRVFLAHDALLDRDIAFSLIKTEGLDDVGRERIMREAQAMGRLSHQNIVAIYDIGEHTRPDGSNQPFLVQELMGGGDVEDLLKDAEGALPLQQSLDVAIATARGLEFAHAQNVIHRDLKPGNVWLTADGIAKIGDLGLAVTLGQSRLTTHGMMVGTFG